MDETRRVLILGKTGSGKSSTANAIFGETLLNVNHTSISGTSRCQAKTRSVNGRGFNLIDTPGFFNTKMPEEVLRSEVVRGMIESAPGPHAFLILLKVKRYSEHEQDVITKIQEIFSEEVFKYATVVFTHGDQLQKGQTIEDFVYTNENLRDLVKKCGGRCHVVDNKYWKDKPEDDYRSNRFQVEQLLQTIDKMKNDNGYHTNKMLQAVERMKQHEKERIRKSAENKFKEEIDERAKNNVFETLMITLAGTGTGVLLGAFFGVKALMKVVLKVFKKAGAAVASAAPEVISGVATAAAGGGEATVGIASAAVETASAAVGTAAAMVLGASALGACVGGYTGLKATEKAGSVWEAIEMAKKAVTEGGQNLCECIDDEMMMKTQKKS